MTNSSIRSTLNADGLTDLLTIVLRPNDIAAFDSHEAITLLGGGVLNHLGQGQSMTAVTVALTALALILDDTE